MRSEKGVTLTSVIIYVLAMLIVVATINVLTSYFYKNVDITSISVDLSQQYTRFNSYFVEEVNKKGNNVVSIGEVPNVSGDGVQKYIIFSSGNQYTYIEKNQGIYINNVKIANNITDCTFSKSDSNEKTIVTVVIKGNDFEKTTNYTLVK